MQPKIMQGLQAGQLKSHAPDLPTGLVPTRSQLSLEIVVGQAPEHLAVDNVLFEGRANLVGQAEAARL